MKPKPFLRRLAIIVIAAMAITLLSYFADPDGIIWFGILHCIAVSSVLGLLFLRLPVIVVIGAGMACIAAPHFAQAPVFNGLGWVWLGLASDVIPSNDYNPLLPWFGYVLLGIAAARILPPQRWPLAWRNWKPHAALSRMLCFAGRHSLLVYLVHQPILMALLWSVAQIR
jgi:uncharacterized membrane protein